MSKLSQWQCCVGTQNGPKKWVLCQIPEAWSQNSAAPADADGCCFIRQEGGSVLSHRGTVFVFHISPGALPLKCESLAHNRH